MSTLFVHPLHSVPAGAVAHSVTATADVADGRPALRISLTDEVTLHGVPGVDYVDAPTFQELPIHCTDGTIEVDIRSRLHRLAPDYARERCRVSVDGQPALEVTSHEGGSDRGSIGLFVDIGTEAFFADLRVDG
jgi:hypothetical protein